MLDEGALLLDADVLMNLAATGRIEHILRTLSLQAWICERTEQEAIFLESRNPGEQREPIDLTPLMSSGLGVRVELTAEEQELYVEHASYVDDGEASVLAVARNRIIRVAMDDRKGRRVADQLGVATIGTPDIMYAFVQREQLPGQTVRELLSDIAKRAHYVPPKDHPLRDWWMDAMQA